MTNNQNRLESEKRRPIEKVSVGIIATIAILSVGSTATLNTQTILTKYASTADGFTDGNPKSIQVAFVTVKKVSLAPYGNQFQMQGTLRNTSGHNITNLDINAMLIDSKSQNVGMVNGITSTNDLSNGQSISFVGILNEDSQSATAVAYKMTFTWETS